MSSEHQKARREKSVSPCATTFEGAPWETEKNQQIMNWTVYDEAMKPFRRTVDVVKSTAPLQPTIGSGSPTIRDLIEEISRGYVNCRSEESQTAITPPLNPEQKTAELILLEDTNMKMNEVLRLVQHQSALIIANSPQVEVQQADDTQELPVDIEDAVKRLLKHTGQGKVDCPFPVCLARSTKITAGQSGRLHCIRAHFPTYFKVSGNKGNSAENQLSILLGTKTVQLRGCQHCSREFHARIDLAAHMKSAHLGAFQVLKQEYLRWKIVSSDQLLHELMMATF